MNFICYMALSMALMHNVAMHKIDVDVNVQSAVRDALVQRGEPQQERGR